MTGYPVGRLNGIDAPLGTIMGPGPTREFYVVSGHDENGILLSYATGDDIATAVLQVMSDGPRSLTEAQFPRVAQP